MASEIEFLRKEIKALREEIYLQRKYFEKKFRFYGRTYNRRENTPVCIPSTFHDAYNDISEDSSAEELEFLYESKKYSPEESNEMRPCNIMHINHIQTKVEYSPLFSPEIKTQSILFPLESIPPLNLNGDYENPRGYTMPEHVFSLKSLDLDKSKLPTLNRTLSSHF